MTNPILESVHPVLMSRDVRRSIDFYETLGFTLVGQDNPKEPKYARLQRDNVELHFQWHDAREWDYPNDRPTYRFPVTDVDAFHAQITAAATKLDIKPVSDTPWGTREFHLRDPDFNGLQFYRWLG